MQQPGNGDQPGHCIVRVPRPVSAWAQRGSPWQNGAYNTTLLLQSLYRLEIREACKMNRLKDNLLLQFSLFSLIIMGVLAAVIVLVLDSRLD